MVVIAIVAITIISCYNPIMIPANENPKVTAWLSFLRGHSLVLQALETGMQKEQHLPLTWFDVLASLYRAPDGRLRMHALAESVFLSRSGLTRLLDRMIAAGVVERENCAEDRRGWQAIITSKGREVIERVSPGHFRRVEEHFLSHLSQSDVQDLHRIMAKIIDANGGQHSSEKT